MADLNNKFKTKQGLSFTYEQEYECIRSMSYFNVRQKPDFLVATKAFFSYIYHKIITNNNKHTKNNWTWNKFYLSVTVYLIAVRKLPLLTFDSLYLCLGFYFCVIFNSICKIIIEKTWLLCVRVYTHVILYLLQQFTTNRSN